MNSSPTTKPPLKPASVASAATRPPAEAKMPNETVRALVSLWLLFHLFGLLLAVLINPNYERQSRLVNAIKRTPGLDQYVHALWLDVPYNYRLTSGQIPDADHTIEAELTYANGDKEVLYFPPQDSRGEQRERYESMARQLAAPVYTEANNSNLVATLGAALLRQTSNRIGGPHPPLAGTAEPPKEVAIRIKRHTPLPLEDLQSTDPAQRDPNNQRTIANIYTATVNLNSVGDPQVNRQAAALDVAPVTNPTPLRSNQNQNPSGGTPSNNSGKKSLQAPLPNPEKAPTPILQRNLLPGSTPAGDAIQP